MSFEAFNFESEILEAINSMGFEKPTPIQEQVIPLILENKDVMACAQTGTGKTAAFVLPILQQIAKNPQKKNSAIILVPTRELVIQIDEQINGMAYFCNVSSVPIYGGGDGSAWETQRTAVENGVEIIVATPGRLMAHMRFSYVDFSGIKHVILDEADRMLDMGFYDDIMNIISKIPVNRQTLMFSATMPSKIQTLAKGIQKHPQFISIAISKPASGILQAAYVVYDKQKDDLLSHLLVGKEDLKSILIFAGRKSSTKEIARSLKRQKLDATAIHSDLEQKEREEVMLNFRNKRVKILVATDILSRGIDVENIDLVINFDVPSDAEDYVHRIGRTARAEASGVALTFIGPAEQGLFQRIEQLIETEVRKIPVPAQFGKTPKYEPFKVKRVNYRKKKSKNSQKRKGGYKNKKK